MHTEREVCKLSVFGEFEDVAGLTVQYRADRIERGEADRTDLARLELLEVDIADADLLAQLIERHFPVRHHAVQPQDNCHASTSQCFIGFLLKLCAVFEYCDKKEDYSYKQYAAEIDCHGKA